MTDRIRAVLEAKPEHLWNLLQSFRRHPPLIAGRWVPERSTTRFTIVRKNPNQHVLVEITRALPNTGDWEMKAIGKLGKVKSRLAKLMNEGPYSFDKLRELTDDILEDEGWTCLKTKFPGTSFGPWQHTENGDHWYRPYHTRGPGIHKTTGTPLVTHREFSNEQDKHKSRWLIPLEGEEDITGTAWDIGIARRNVDDVLIKLGFDLAQPDAHDLVLMQREHDAKDTKQSHAAKDMKMVFNPNGYHYIDKNGQKWSAPDFFNGEMRKIQ